MINLQNNRNAQLPKVSHNARNVHKQYWRPLDIDAILSTFIAWPGFLESLMCEGNLPSLIWRVNTNPESTYSGPFSGGPGFGVKQLLA